MASVLVSVAPTNPFWYARLYSIKLAHKKEIHALINFPMAINIFDRGLLLALVATSQLPAAHYHLGREREKKKRKK